MDLKKFKKFKWNKYELLYYLDFVFLYPWCYVRLIINLYNIITLKAYKIKRRRKINYKCSFLLYYIEKLKDSQIRYDGTRKSNRHIYIYIYVCVWQKEKGLFRFRSLGKA